LGLVTELADIFVNVVEFILNVVELIMNVAELFVNVVELILNVVELFIFPPIISKMLSKKSRFAYKRNGIVYFHLIFSRLIPII
jgi:hypothetical protein